MKPESLLSMDAMPVDERLPLIGIWHSLFKSQGKDIPSAAFMGGTFERICLAFFKRPLIPNDFVRLWNLVSVDTGE